MSALSEVSVPVSARHVTLSLRITGARKLRWRMWLGAKIIKVAAHVIGCKCRCKIGIDG